MHSKAQVLQTYFNAQESTQTRPVLKPHSSRAPSDTANSLGIKYTSSPHAENTTGSDTASKQHLHSQFKTYTNPIPAQSTGMRPAFRNCSPRASYSSTCKGQALGDNTAAAEAARPVQLVQIKPNVWLPMSVVQQANGDVELALHLAAQGSLVTESLQGSGNSPITGKAWPSDTTAKPSPGDSFLFRQEMGSDNLKSRSHSNTDGRAMVQQRSTDFAPWSHSSQQAVDSSNMQSQFQSALRLKAESIANGGIGQSKFDPTIQPLAYQSLHGEVTNCIHGMGRSQTASQTANNNAYGYRSPTVPMSNGSSGNTNTYVSPKCMMDNNSLFSYNVATPEQMVHSRPAPWFATPDINPTQAWGGAHTQNINPASFNPAAYYPELNPSAAHLHMGQPYGLGLSNYSGVVHDSPTGTAAYVGNPWHDSNVPVGMTHHACGNLEMQSSMAASMGSHSVADDPSGAVLFGCTLPHSM